MSVDWASSLYDRLYAVLGVDAVLTLVESGATKTLTVIDRTAGIEVDIGGNVSMPSIKPACAVRVPELTENDVTLDELKGSTIAFNDGTWRVESKMFKPGPAGEMQGEVYLLLIEART